MDEIEKYMSIDFDYILYETLECGMIKIDIPYLTNIEHMKRAKEKLNAVIMDCKSTIERIDKRLKEVNEMEGTWFLIEVKEQEDIGKNEERRIKVTNTTLKFDDIKPVTYARGFRGSGVDVHPATNGVE